MAHMVHRLRTTSLRSRPSLVRLRDFAGVPPPNASARALLESLPDIHAGRALRRLASAIRLARRRRRPVVLAHGGHVVKVGIAPILIDLIRRGYLTALAMNGGAAIHDLEIAMAGKTSEDVATALSNGTFGMARETAEAFAEAAANGRRVGLGRALGELILRRRMRHADISLLAAAARAGIPATVHVALGADITHMHPMLDAAALGEASLRDFHTVTDIVCRLEGGVWINAGSAVILPEVFLKAVAIARNTGARLRRFVAANLDQIQHYRPNVNVLERPGGEAISLTGHHEILFPLLRIAILTNGGRR
jgi:hypothetical protein